MSNSIRLLTVDDEVDYTQTIEKYFKLKGYIVSVANNGREALEILKKEEFDVIVLDLLMPEMPGQEVLKVIKEKYPNVCVVILSVLGEIKIATEMVRSGAYDHIPKPFEFSVLEKAVEKGVEFQRLLNKIEKEKMKCQRERRKGDEKFRIFIKGLNHHVKTAIFGISENAQLLLNSFPKGSNNNESIIRIDIFANRIKIITKQLSNLEKVDKDDFRKIELLKIIENSLYHSKYDHKLQHGIEVNKKYSPDIQVFASPLYIGIAFENLLNNAVEAMEQCNYKKKLTITTAPIDGKSVEIRFSDTGVGINDEIKDRIFEPYFTTKMKKSSGNDIDTFGRGFGLFFTKEIIRIHEGEIDIESTDIGSTFILKLPMIEALQQ